LPALSRRFARVRDGSGPIAKEAVMKRLPVLLAAAAATLALAAAAGACGDTPNAVNLVLTPDVKPALRHAYIAANPAVASELVPAPVPGRTYYGFHVGIRYALATFAVPGHSAYPAIFTDQGRGRWKLLRLSGGLVCARDVPVDLIQAWALVPWRRGCYSEPGS
jgi:hypothetical protein